MFVSLSVIAFGVVSAIPNRQQDEPTSLDFLIATLQDADDKGVLPDSISDLLVGWFIENLIAPSTGETPVEVRERLSAQLTLTPVRTVVMPEPSIMGAPTYGGTLRLARASDPGSKWDMCEFLNQELLTYSVENFLFGDYNKGPSGSGETTYLPVLGFGTDKLAIGSLADS